MSINNTILRTRIEKRIIPYLDETLRKKYNIKNDYSFGLIVYFLMQKFDLSLNEAIFCVTDGSNDKGIDAIYINEITTEVHIIQSEFLKNIDKTALGENKIRLTLDGIFGIMDDKIKDMNPFLRNKIDEIIALASNKGIPKINIHFIANAYFPVNREENAEYREAVGGNRNYSIQWHNILNLVSLESISNQKFEVNIRVKTDKYTQATDVGEIRGIVATISSLDLLKIYKEGGYENVFEYNIRNYLGSKPINKKIYETATNLVKSKHFWFFNNGISLICDKYIVSDIGFGQKNIKLENPKIINGGQTTKTLIELENDLTNGIFDNTELARKTFEKVELLIRIYETSDIDLIKQITIGTNTQNAISKQDLQAGNSIAQSIQTYFEENNYGLEIKKNEYVTGTKQKQAQNLRYIANQDEVLQFYVSIYKERPDKAYISKAQIFADYFETIFSPSNIKLPQEYLRAFEIGYFVQNQIKTEDISNGNSFLANCSIFMMYVITQTDQNARDITKKLNYVELLKTYQNAKNIIKQLVAERRGREQDLYSNNKYFKTEECKKDFLIWKRKSS